MPVLRRPAGPAGTRLPPGERFPPLSGPTPSSASATGCPGDLLDLLSRGDLEVEGRIVDASNATLLAQVELDGVRELCVYKPVAGERPLRDFPTGTLAGREVAAFQLSDAAGWAVVPPTVLRDGPFGRGSVQLWVHPQDETTAAPGAGLVDVVPAGAVPPGWLDVLDAYGADGEPVTLVHADDPELAVLAGFDLLANNADRKGGHVLVGPVGERVGPVGIDHGLTFHDEPKLRTVLWGWAGDPLPEPVVAGLQRLGRALAGGPVVESLAPLLAPEELEALRRRRERLLRRPLFPQPPPHRYPIPWPPF